MPHVRYKISCQDFELHEWRFSHFNEKFISRLCGSECFGVWPRHSYFKFF